MSTLRPTTSESSAKLTVWTLTLENDGSAPKDKLFIRIKPDDKRVNAIRFCIPAGYSASSSPVLYTNYPLDGSEYQRSRFHKKSFRQDEEGSGMICEFLATRPGPYQYYVEYSEVSSANGGIRTTRASPVSYFLVDPILSQNGRWLPLDGIVMQSIGPKWLGPLSSWKQQLSQSACLGYNMLHFMPLQQRGSSNSPYSIYDQLALADELFVDMPNPPASNQEKLDLLKALLDELETEHGLLGIADMVWNHTANNSEWLQHHPEAGYNVKNSPHLRAALELDNALDLFGSELEKYGISRWVHSSEDVDRIIEAIESHVLRPLDLWQFYVVDVEGVTTRVADLIDRGVRPDGADDPELLAASTNFRSNEALQILSAKLRIPSRLGERYHRTPDPKDALAVLHSLCGPNAPKDTMLAKLKAVLDLVNLPLYREYDADVAAIKSNLRNRLLYERLDKYSYKYQKPIDDQYKLVEPVFTRLPVNSVTEKLDRDEMALANNGWVYGADPLVNFAGPDSKAYLRREVIIWGDCVKLNYGTKREDNPWLWDHMRKYTLAMARLFHGFRIDNCHSTPIELAEFLLDEARVVRPNLYLIAELFTGSEDSDRIFVSRLGLNSLVRESMQAWDPHELSRVIHRNGGVPVGSMDLDCLEEPGVFTDGNGLVTTCVVAPIRASLPHAIFFDCTHDNKTPFQLRQACDALPNAALVAMTACAVGSNKGYDELYSYLLDVVNEQRRYLLLDDPLSVGIGKARRALNEIHREMASYQEIHVHHEGEFITVHRQHPVTRNGYLLVAHCAFPGARDNAPFSNARLYGTVAEAVLSYRLVVEGDGHEHDSDGYLHGLPATLKELAPPPLELGHDEKGPYTELRLPEGFGPGSILLVRTRPEGFPDGLEEIIAEGCEDAVSRLGLGALNAVLYRCSSEEHDTVGSGVYDVPGLGSLAYAGLQGWVSHLQHIIPNNDLGHSLCAHLRSGHWALDYITNRLEKYQQQLYPELSALTSWFAERFSLVKQAPSFLTPKYFAMVVTLAYKCAVKRALSLMSPEITGFSDFGRRLALTSVQMVGATTSCSLRPFDDKKQLSMAAGLPHFTTHHMRCWGRDIFISLEGLLMKTGRHNVARDHILAFGSTLKHGLIPNLLDSGRYPRYNARDATWFWLKAVQDYCRESAEGLEFLGVEVDRRFQADDTFAAWDEEGRAYARKSTVAELVQEIMQAHARGISFREWNAGPALDQAMRDEGFNIDIYVDWRNGLVKGGNDFNCGTWMDKMGDSDKAGIRGIPGSPRDGADIEIIGLLKYTVSWLTTLATEGSKWFPYKGVSALMAVEGGRETTTVTYEQWSELLKANFEKGFYVPEDEALDAEYHVKSELVNQRGIYRDTVEATREWADYQFRPNIPVAMVVAPELFDPNHARTCLKKMGQVLCGPLGMRTLDPRDMRYRPYYDNSNDSDDPTVAHGINYHAGPEWVWCMGYYLQALLIFFSRTEEEKQATLQEVHRHLLPLARHIATTQFAGLPELTNLNGTECPDSCPTQAWSAATIITLLSRMNKM